MDHPNKQEALSTNPTILMLPAASTYEFSCKYKTYKLLGNDGHLQSNIQHKGNKIMITCKNSTMRLETFC
jgi:hypothetical protein